MKNGPNEIISIKYGRQLFIIFSVCGNLFLAGIGMGWGSPTLPKLLDEEQTPFDHILSQSEIAIMTTLSLSNLCIPMFTACLRNYVICANNFPEYHFSIIHVDFSEEYREKVPFADPLSRRYGRKPMLIANAFMCVISWFTMSITTNIYILYAVKFLEGHATGLSYFISIVYISEIVSVPIRGFALTCIGIFINLGILTVYCMGPFLTYNTLALTVSGFAVAVLASVMFVPESPMHLIAIGKKDAAKAVLYSLGRKDIENNSEQDESLLNKKQSKSEEVSIWFKLKLLVNSKKNCKALLIVSVACIAAHSTGVMPILMHMTEIFKKAGTPLQPYIAAIIVATIQLLSSIFSSLLIDKVGRKVLLLTSCGVTCLCNLTIGLVFYLEYIKSPMVQYITWLPLLCLITFVVFYAIGLGILPGTLAGELLDEKVKTIGSSIFAVETATTAMIAVCTFGYINEYLGDYSTFWLYSVSSAVTFIFMYVSLPETKGKTFVEIQEMLT